MKTAKIIILAGQSNAVGVGHTRYLTNSFTENEIAKFKSGYDNVQISYTSHNIKSDGFVKTTTGCTEKNRDTLGPEVGIAKKLSEKYPGEQFFIVKCAIGGVNMHTDWRPPTSGVPYVEEKNAVLPESVNDTSVRFPGWCYNELRKRLRSSLAELEAKGYAPSIIAFCWMQGESDSKNPEHVSAYIERYDALLKDVREAFPSYFSDSCKYIDAGVSEVWKYYAEMNANKKAFAEKNGFIFVDTVAAGLTTKNEPVEKPDTAHYDCASTVKLGELFAEHI